MSLDSVKKVHPNYKESKYENSVTLTKKEKLPKGEADWGYRFDNNKLDWIYYQKYVHELNEKNFNDCLAEARRLIAGLTEEFGSADFMQEGQTKFVDPAKKHHWGYKVIEARWNNAKGMKIKVEFTFMGGKGQYAFLVKENRFGKDYPYFD